MRSDSGDRVHKAPTSVPNIDLHDVASNKNNRGFYMTGRFSQPDLGSKIENKVQKMNATSRGTNVWASMNIGDASPDKSTKRYLATKFKAH